MIDIQWIEVGGFDLDHVSAWFKKICASEGRTLGEVNLVMGTDDWLLTYNQNYLNHDYYTDIITFDYTEGNNISGDLLISLERVWENAESHNVSRETELNRVLVHGLLHLCGYRDKTADDIKIMREKEDFYLSLL